MKPVLTIGLAALALAGCGKADGELKPGNWKQDATIVAFDVPGMPPAMKQAMTASMGKTNTDFRCIQPAEAKTGVRALASSFQDGDCQMSDYTASGGKLSGTLKCKTGEKGGSMDMKLSGTYSEERMDIDVDAAIVDASMPQGKAQLKMKLVATHTGDCAAKPG